MLRTPDQTPQQAPQQPPQVRKRPLLCAGYNNKGGVGKTTSTYNMAYLAAKELGLRVLMVDFDPQANLTALIEAPSFSSPSASAAYYQRAAARTTGGTRHITVTDIFRPLLDDSAMNVSRAEAVELTPVHDYEDLFYIPGHLEIGGLDKIVTLGMSRVPLSQDYPLLLTDIFRRIAEIHRIDLVFFDLNPNSSATNKAIIGGSDYVIIPFFPDIFSYQAMESIKRIFPEAIRDLAVLRERASHAEYRHIRPPFVLGAFPQKTSIRKESGVDVFKPVESYGDWIQRIYNAFREIWTTTFANPSDGSPPLTAPGATFKALGGLSDFVSAGTDAQHSGRPMSDLYFQHKHYTEGHEKRLLNRGERERKKRAHDSYLKIMGSLFLNMCEEDLQMLGPDIRQTLVTWASLAETSVDIHSLNIPRPSDSRSSAPINEGDSATTTAVYTDRQIAQLMAHYFSSADFAYTGVILLERISNRDTERFTVATEILKRKLRELPFQGSQLIKWLFVPIKFDNNHWVMVMIQSPQLRRTTERQVGSPWIYYCDPIGDPLPQTVKSLIQECINADYPGLELEQRPSENIRLLERRVQEDSFNCGPWIIELARIFSAAQATPRATEDGIDINTARQEHTQILSLPRSAAHPSRRRAASSIYSSDDHTTQRRVRHHPAPAQEQQGQTTSHHRMR